MSIDTKSKSTFINVLAWIFIIFGGFSTFIAVLQNAMFHLVFNNAEMNKTIQASESAGDTPGFAGLIFNNIHLLLFAFLVISATSLVSAIALLKRRNWARIVFIALMSFGIAWNILVFILQFGVAQFIQGAKQAPPEVESMMNIMQYASVIFVGAICLLFGFVIHKLTSHKIRQEFI